MGWHYLSIPKRQRYNGNFDYNCISFPNNTQVHRAIDFQEQKYNAFYVAMHIQTRKLDYILLNYQRTPTLSNTMIDIQR